MSVFLQQNYEVYTPQVNLLESIMSLSKIDLQRDPRETSECACDKTVVRETSNSKRLLNRIVENTSSINANFN